MVVVVFVLVDLVVEIVAVAFLLVAVGGGLGGRHRNWHDGIRSVEIKDGSSS